MLQSLYLLYGHSCMLLYAHKCLDTMKVMAVEEVLWCVYLILFSILGIVFHKNEVA